MAGPSAAAQLQSVCYPDTEEARDWPIGVIYLHGYHPLPGQERTNPGGPPTEQGNREILRQLAERLAAQRIRIAIPVAPHHYSGRYGNNYAWNGTNRVPMDRLEAEAQAACGGADLAVPRSLIGFSDGGYAVKHYAGDCTRMADYKHIIAIGAPGGRRNTNPPCNTLMNRDPHVLPDVAGLLNLLEQNPSGREWEVRPTVQARPVIETEGGYVEPAIWGTE